MTKVCLFHSKKLKTFELVDSKNCPFCRIEGKI